MPEPTWLPNLGSQLDRALRATIIASGAATASQVFPVTDFRTRPNPPIVDIRSHSGIPSPRPQVGNYDFEVDLIFKFNASVPHGHADPESWRREMDIFIGAVMYQLFLLDYADGLPTVCDAINAAGRALKTAGSDEDQANNVDMGDFTCLHIAPGAESRGHPINEEGGVDASLWVERRSLTITCCSRNVS